MKTTLYSLLAATIFSFLSSCTEKIDIDLDSTYSRLVVEGSITSDTTAHEVILKKSADYFSNKPLEPVSGARVTITDGTQVFTLTEDPNRPGVYLTQPDVYGVPGNEYSLQIENVDIDQNGSFESYEGSSHMYNLAGYDSIQVVEVKMFYTTLWEVRFYAHEPGDERNYYLFTVGKNGKMVKDTLLEGNFMDDEMINGSYSAGMPVQYLFKDKPDEIVNVGDTILLEVKSISKEYHSFAMELMFESHGSDPFGGQPANLSTNMSNGAIGFFNANDVKRATTIFTGLKR